MIGSKILSIIVPTYNVEAFLNKCLSSLVVGDKELELMQSLEVLVINDGSKDRSSEIAHQYESRFPETFKVIDKENGNYGSCINAALPMVNGKYVRILDADDSFDSMVFADYLELLQNVDVDMIYSDHVTVNMAGKYGSRTRLGVTPMKELNFRDYPQIYRKISMHGVTYKTSIFEGLEYHQTEGIYYTDWEWVHLPMSRVESFMYYPHVLYRYLKGRPGQSVSPDVYSKSFAMSVQGMMVLFDTYMSCKGRNGKWNGNSVNTDYLRVRCISRTEALYFNLLSQHKSSSSVSYLQELDDMMRMRYPDMHEEMDNIIHTNPYMPRLSLPLRYIGCLHKQGIKSAAVQVRILNHWSGLSKRIARMMTSRTK